MLYGRCYVQGRVAVHVHLGVGGSIFFCHLCSTGAKYSHVHFFRCACILTCPCMYTFIIPWHGVGCV